MGLLVCLETNKFVSRNLKRLGRQLTQSSEEPGDPMPIPTSFVLNAPVRTEPPTLPSSPTPVPTPSRLAAFESSRNRAETPWQRLGRGVKTETSRSRQTSFRLVRHVENYLGINTINGATLLDLRARASAGPHFCRWRADDEEGDPQPPGKVPPSPLPRP